MLQLPIVVKLETSIQGHSILDFCLCLNSRKTLKPLRSDRLDTFAKRQHLSVTDYEKLFYEEAQLDDTGSTQFADYQTGAFHLTEISEHQRIYKGN